MEVSEASCRLLADLLQNRTGQQLTTSRHWRIGTALGPLLRERGLASVDQLVVAILGGRDALLKEKVVEALLNNETFFYRDRPSFDQLLGPALSRLEGARTRERRLAIWCAGCSTGQEVYSLAMAFAEQKQRWSGWTIEILGTDVSRSVIEQARAGLYSQFEVQRGLPVLQMMRWFDEQPGASWRISSEIRRMVGFQLHSLVEPPPRPGRFDIILCRNVLLYFSKAMRRTVLARLASACADDGALMLGAGETVIGQTDAFIPDPGCRGVYIRANQPTVAARAAS
jgi:chemotaxis protein methyltransferase CheR